jgi:hypothetical protein
MVSNEDTETGRRNEAYQVRACSFRKGGIFNRKEPAVKQRIMDLEMQLAELETESMQERRTA